MARLAVGYSLHTVHDVCTCLENFKIGTTDLSPAFSDDLAFSLTISLITLSHTHIPHLLLKEYEDLPPCLCLVDLTLSEV